MTCPICRWISAAGLLALLASIVVPIAVSAAGRTDPDQNVDWTPPTNTSNWVWQPPTGVPGPTPPPTPLPTCAAGTQTWTVGSFSCSGDLAGATAPETKTATDATKPNTGSADFTCHRVKGWVGPRSGATCGPTDCPAESVEWTVVEGGPACTGSTAKTDIGLTYVVSGTRKSPAAGSANGTFLCQTDGTWAHQDPGTDTCPQDCDPPASDTDATWAGTSHNETWTCSAPYPTQPTPARTQWIVGDQVGVSDDTPREGSDPQDGIGTATVACVAASGSIQGSFDVATPQCAPADCSPGDTYWYQRHLLRCPTQGGPWPHRYYKVWCSSDAPLPLPHAATGQLSDALDPHSSDDRTSGSTTGACDNSEFTPVNSACTPYYSGYGGYYTRDRNALTGVSRNSELDDPRGCPS